MGKSATRQCWTIQNFGATAGMTNVLEHCKSLNGCAKLDFALQLKADKGPHA